MKSCQIFCVAGSLVFSALAGPRQSLADITTTSFIFTESNTFADGIAYGSVDIEADSDLGLITFTVEVIDVQPEYGELGANFGIDKFGFNFQNLTSAPGTWDVSLPDGWSQDDGGGNLDGFGLFLVHEIDPGDRVLSLVFTIELATASEAIVSNFVVLSTGDAGQGNAFFAAHVAGFGEGDEDNPGSHYVGVIPAPGAALLAAIGLAPIVWLKRRFT